MTQHRVKFISVVLLYCCVTLTHFSSTVQAGIQVEKRGACSQDFEFHNGFTTVIENGNVILFECQSGFVPFGSMKSTCVDGSWDNEPPKCIKKGCNQLKIPIHGRVEEEYSGALVKFQCDSGYKLNGSATLTCDGRQWSASTPVCDAIPREVVQNGGLNKTDL